MSGGWFDYLDNQLKHRIFGYNDEVRNVFEDREISELVFDVLDLIHDYDWYASGDTMRETYVQAKDKFKAKWFVNGDERVKRIVDRAIDELRRELYEMYGIERGDRAVL